MSCDYEWLIGEEAKLLSLLHRDGNQSPVARELFDVAHGLLLDRHREWRKAKEWAQSKYDKDGNLKPRTRVELEVMLTAIAILRDEECWDDMLIELPIELVDRGIKVSRNTLNGILEKSRGFIERKIMREKASEE